MILTYTTLPIQRPLPSPQETTTYTTAINDGIRVTTGIEGCGSSCGGTNKYYTYNQWNEVTSVISRPGYTTTYTYNEPANFYDRAGDIASMTEADTWCSRRIVPQPTPIPTVPDDPFLLTQKTETKASVANPGQNKVITTHPTIAATARSLP